jgi:hypothetical protein
MARDLFQLQVPHHDTHVLFQRLTAGTTHTAARAMMNLVFAEFRDVDASSSTGRVVPPTLSYAATGRSRSR